MQSSDAQLLAAGRDVLGSQHGGVGGGLVTVGLDLHATGDTANGFAATGITQNVSLNFEHHLKSVSPSQGTVALWFGPPLSVCPSWRDSIKG